MNYRPNTFLDISYASVFFKRFRNWPRLDYEHDQQFQLTLLEEPPLPSWWCSILGLKTSKQEIGTIGTPLLHR